MTFEDAHRRIRRGDLIALRNALDAGLDPNLANQFSWTLLMLAASEGNTQIGEMLFAKGAEVERQNNFGETALSLAAHKGHERFVDWLLRIGATTDVQPHGRSLRNWIVQTSGLSSAKQQSMLALLRLLQLH
jgi:ankyrin repeat protein